jgi:hypothetical protein
VCYRIVRSFALIAARASSIYFILLFYRLLSSSSCVEPLRRTSSSYSRPRNIATEESSTQLSHDPRLVAGKSRRLHGGRSAAFAKATPAARAQLPRRDLCGSLEFVISVGINERLH